MGTGHSPAHAAVTTPAIAEWHNGTPLFPRRSADGRFHVTHGGDTQFNQFDTTILRVWNVSGLQSWSVKKGLPGRHGYGFAADGLRLCVVEDKGLAVYDSTTGCLVELLPYTTPLTKREWAGAVAFTRMGTRLSPHILRDSPPGRSAAPVRPAKSGFAHGDSLEGREGLLTLAPDGRLAVVETDQLDLLVYEVNTLQEHFRIRNRAPWPSLVVPFHSRWALPDRIKRRQHGDHPRSVRRHRRPMDWHLPQRRKPGPASWPARPTLFSPCDGSRDIRTRPWKVCISTSVPHDHCPSKSTASFASWMRPVIKSASRQGELTRLAHASRPALLAASRTDMSPEMRQRVELLLKTTRGPDLSSEGICIHRAVELLERLQTAKATALLREWSEGPPGDTLADAARESAGTRTLRDCWRTSADAIPSFQFMDVIEHAAGNAHCKHRQVALGFVLHPARDVNHDALVNLDFLVIENHRSAPGNDVVKLVRSFVIVQLGIANLDVMDFAGGTVLFFHETADLAARLRPRLHLGRIATQELSGVRHRISLGLVRGTLLLGESAARAWVYNGKSWQRRVVC